MSNTHYDNRIKIEQGMVETVYFNFSYALLLA
jgi:hypothetical protein